MFYFLSFFLTVFFEVPWTAASFSHSGTRKTYAPFFHCENRCTSGAGAENIQATNASTPAPCRAEPRGPQEVPLKREVAFSRKFGHISRLILRFELDIGWLNDARIMRCSLKIKECVQMCFFCSAVVKGGCNLLAGSRSYKSCRTGRWASSLNTLKLQSAILCFVCFFSFLFF